MLKKHVNVVSAGYTTAITDTDAVLAALYKSTTGMDPSQQLKDL